MSPASGLQTRRFPTSNTYMDDPFHLGGAGRDQPIYSNSSILEHMVRPLATLRSAHQWTSENTSDTITTPEHLRVQLRVSSSRGHTVH